MKRRHDGSQPLSPGQMQTRDGSRRDERHIVNCQCRTCRRMRAKSADNAYSVNLDQDSE